MAKFILVNDYGDFEKMKDYINSNRKKNYYIAPNLMYSLLSSPYRCVVGLIMDDIKVRSQDKIDIITKSVYNKVFQREAFRVDAIKNYYLRNVVHIRHTRRIWKWWLASRGSWNIIWRETK